MNTQITLDSWRVNVRKIRKDRHITQQEMAEISGIRQPRISQIESGQVEPKMSEIIDMSNALKMAVVMVPGRLLESVQVSVREFERLNPQGRRRTIPELILGDSFDVA